jgi:hypothetical protein
MELQIIQSKIHEIRGHKIMLDFDLAEIYQVETRMLNQAVKRNIERFPSDFMFQLRPTEWRDMSSQFVMTSRTKRPKSAVPLAFTEHGVVMLSSVLRSDKELKTYIESVFIDYNDINEDTRMQLELINQSLAELQTQKKISEKPRKRIGFIVDDEDEK